MLAMEESASMLCARVMRGHQFHGEERGAALRDLPRQPRLRKGIAKPITVCRLV